MYRGASNKVECRDEPQSSCESPSITMFYPTVIKLAEDIEASFSLEGKISLLIGRTKIVTNLDLLQRVCNLGRNLMDHNSIREAQIKLNAQRNIEFHQSEIEKIQKGVE